MKTLLLDNTYWDLLTDTSGNIALASEPYALAQDVASAVRLFSGELYYDTSKGVPYFDEVLGELPPVPVVEQLLVAAALTVPTVVQAVTTLTSFSGRVLTGTIDFIDDTGAANHVNI